MGNRVQIFAIVAHWNFFDGRGWRFGMSGGFEAPEEFLGSVYWLRKDARIELQQYRGEGRHEFDKAGWGMSLQIRHDAALAGQRFFAEVFSKAKQQRVWAVSNPVHSLVLGGRLTGSRRIEKHQIAANQAKPAVRQCSSRPGRSFDPRRRSKSTRGHPRIGRRHS